jgi:malate dehydrogenase (oxaloacetate-decarboxylating)
VTYAGRTIQIGQCNNAFIFPGVGLGVIAARARHVSDSMFVAAARALSACAPVRRDPAAALYPAVEEIRTVSRQVALAVAVEAQRVGLAEPTTPEELERRVTATMWVPQYAQLTRA